MEEGVGDYKKSKGANVNHASYTVTTRSAKRKMELAELPSTLQGVLTLVQKSNDVRSDIDLPKC